MLQSWVRTRSSGVEPPCASPAPQQSPTARPGSAPPPRKAPPALDKVLDNAADAIGMLREVDEEDGIARVELWATGTVNIDGQRFTLTKFRASINYDEPGIRIDFTRAGADGKELPREIQILPPAPSHGTLRAGYRRDARQRDGGGVHPGDLESCPSGVIKAARAAGAKATVAAEGDRTAPTVPVGRATLKATINAQNLIDRVETRLGTVVTETTYADYRELNDADDKADVFWPRRITQKRDGVTVLDSTLDAHQHLQQVLYVIMPGARQCQEGGAGRAGLMQGVPPTATEGSRSGPCSRCLGLSSATAAAPRFASRHAGRVRQEQAEDDHRRHDQGLVGQSTRQLDHGRQGTGRKHDNLDARRRRSRRISGPPA